MNRALSLWVDWGGKKLGERTDASPASHREVETHGHAISILFRFWTSYICDTYIVLTWNNRTKSGPGASSSSNEPQAGIQQNRRQGRTKEDQSQVPEAGDI
ncbi:small integral membrane protein 2 [Diceros bicornis minor]|uniref:small integral membrane protein 2 n=1 Tax=Diceros bicornis minor TaxID=77932 RepID=UPI0026F06BD3|nr:small integral membrane protein 2 [Diceros bicornis minor]